MLVSEVEPINRFGVNLLKKANGDELINELIELPLRKPCRILKEKGIETCMSSANKNNILPYGVKPTEKEDVYGRQFYLDSPTYEDAGRGYAWIMLNYKTLSDENKDLLFSLEERNNEKGENVGGNAIWFVSAAEEKMNPFVNQSSIETGPRAEEFRKRRGILRYDYAKYPINSVFLRMPINEETTVEEVEEFFTQFALSFHNQVREHDIQALEDRY